MLNRLQTVDGVKGLRPVGADWFSVDNSFHTEYISILEGEPGLRTYGTEIQVHLTHLPLLPNWAPDIRETKRPFWLDKNWWDKLRGYQREGIDFARGRLGCHLLDDMGLGKSRMALGSADPPALIICPVTAVVVWETECEDAGLNYRTVRGVAWDLDDVNSLFNEKEKIQVWIVPYSVCSSWLPFFTSLGMGPTIHTLIPDEAHELQNPRGGAAKAFSTVDFQRGILLTATPMRNRLVSYWSLLDVVSRGKPWGYHGSFRVRYCGAKTGEWGLVDGTPSREDVLRLRRRLQAVALKRTRSQVGHFVVPLVREVVEADIDPARMADLITDQTAKDVGKFRAIRSKGADTLKLLNRLRVAYGIAKAERIRTIVEPRMVEWPRVVIWIWHEQVAGMVQDLLAPLNVPIDVLLGSTPAKKRKDIVKEWKSGNPKEPRILVCSIGAGSTAISLTSAGLAIFLEVDYAPLQMTQAEKRTHRFGQTNDSTKAIYVSAGKNTIDRKIIEILIEKAEESERVFGEDGSLEQMETLLGVSKESSDEDFMRRLGERLQGGTE